MLSTRGRRDRTVAGPHRASPLLTAFVVTAAAGDLTLRPLMAAHLATVLACGAAALALWAARGSAWRRPAPSALLAFAVLALAWVPIASGRAPDAAEGRAEVSGLVAGLAVAVGVAAASRGTWSGLVAMRRGWALALALSCGVALVELVTDAHLWIPAGHSWAETSRTIVAGAFRNPNDFAVALTAMISGTLAWRRDAGPPGRRVAVALAALGAGFVLLTESRAGLLALLVVLGLHAAGARSGRREGRPVRGSARRPHRFLVPALAALVVAVGVAAFTLPALAARNPVARLIAAAADPGTSRSDGLRVGLLRAAARYAADSDGLGTGAASFEPLLAADPSPGVSTRTWLHNTFAELALQYGVLVAGGLLVLLAVLTLGLRPRRRGRRPAVAHPSRPRARRLVTARVEGAAALVAFVALGCVASTALTTPIWWLVLGQAAASAWWCSVPPRGPSQHAPGPSARGARRAPAETLSAPRTAPAPARALRTVRAVPVIAPGGVLPARGGR